MSIFSSVHFCTVFKCHWRELPLTGGAEGWEKSEKANAENTKNKCGISEHQKVRGFNLNCFVVALSAKEEEER